MATIKELTDLKQRIDDKKAERNRLEGQLADRMARLKALGFDSVDAANVELDRLHEQLADLDAQLQTGTDALRKDYGL